MKKKNNQSRLALVLLLLLSAALVFGGGSKETKTVTLTFTNWVSAEEGTRDMVAKLLAKFQEENPSIKIENKPIPVSDIEKQLVVMATAKNAPDITQVQGEMVFTLAASKFLEPVDDLLPPSLKADFPQNVYDNSGLMDGKHYAVPWASTVNGFLYNKKLMQQAGLDPNKPPRTMAELTQMLDQAREKLPKEVILLQLDTTIRTIGLFHQWPIMLTFNNHVPPIDEKGGIHVNTPGMKAYGEWLRKQMVKGHSLPGKRYGEFRPQAAQGRLLFGIDGAYVQGMWKSMNKALTDKEIFETWGVAEIPGADGKFYTGDANHCLTIFNTSKNKEAAMKFATFMVSSEFALKNYILPVGFVPVTKSALEKVPELKANPITSAFVTKVLPTTVKLPFGPNYSKAAEIIMTGVQTIISTETPVEVVLADIQKKLEELYKK